MSPAAEAFEAQRDVLMGVAYRMMGSLSEAEDVLQDDWFRWDAASDIEHPRSWLTKVVVRLCIDRLRSARARRETYVGPWLPEPWVGLPPPPDPVLASSLSFAFLRLLETLTPAQRAALLLRDVFDEDYTTIADILRMELPAVRQLVSRARRHLSGEPRYSVDMSQHAELLTAFGVAAAQGDISSLARLLADDAVAITDGGGKVRAAGKPILGGAKIAKAYAAFAKGFPRDARFEPTWVNGLPGVITRVGDRVFSVHVIELGAGGIVGLYAVLNPEKLGRVAGG